MEIVKTTAGWHDLRLNPGDTPAAPGKYLCAFAEEGIATRYMVLDYCDGWNVTALSSGEIYRDSEIFSVTAWQQIEPFK